jgi:hypothetical protein
VRSKGVGVFFVTQNPGDIPDSVLAQLGNRVQHALRAFTPRDQTALRATADTMRENPKLDIERAIGELAVGEALLSFLDAKGRPSVTERAYVIPPGSRIGPITPAERRTLIDGSIVAGVYEKTVDRVSAYEELAQRTARAQPSAPPVRGGAEAGNGAPAPPPSGAARPTETAPPAGTAPTAGEGGGLMGELGKLVFGTTGPRGGHHEGLAESMAKSAVRSIGSAVGREVIRGVLGGIMGSKRR